MAINTETAGFHDFFGFAPDYTTLALSINGDDAIELFVRSRVIISLEAGNGYSWLES